MRFAPFDQKFDVVSESYQCFYVSIAYLVVMPYNSPLFIYISKLVVSMIVFPGSDFFFISHEAVMDGKTVIKL